MRAPRSSLLLCLVTLAFVAGCALYTRQEPETPVAEQATVVFMQGRWGGGYAFVYEGDEFLGVTGPGTRMQVSRPAGEHLFAVVSDNVDFMTAQLQGGQTYHVTIRPAPGFSRNRVYFQPRNEQGDITDAYASTTPVVPTERGEKFGSKYRERKDRLHERTWSKWSGLPPEKKAHLETPTQH